MRTKTPGRLLTDEELRMVKHAKAIIAVKNIWHYTAYRDLTDDARWLGLPSADIVSGAPNAPKWYT